MARPAAPRASSAPTEAVGRYLAALNAHDPDAVCEVVTEDFYNEHTSAGGRSLRGREAYRGRLPEFFDSYHPHYEVERCVADDDTVALSYRFTGDYGQDASPRRPFSVRGTFWFQVGDGLVAHRIDYYDSATFARQVGLTR